MREEFSPSTRPEFDRLCVVLVRARNPLNIGAAARAMSNFGFAHLRVVNPYGPAFGTPPQPSARQRCSRQPKHTTAWPKPWPTARSLVGTTAVGKRSIKHTIARLERLCESSPRAGCGKSARPVRRAGCVKKTRNRPAVRKMKEGPSESPCRGRLQTAISCFSQKLRW
jgi:hypothetical protein